MIGTNYKVLPYLVDKDLEPKVNQPQALMQNVRRIAIKNPYQVSISWAKLDRIVNIRNIFITL